MRSVKRLHIFLVLLALISHITACTKSNPDTAHRLQWWLPAINWDVESRTNGLTGKGILIAVIDTAIDQSHPDLENKIIEQHIVEGVSEEELSLEHGTAVAGIICASPKNADGVLGIATEAKILSIVISSGTEAKVESLIEGIKYAIEKKVDIINISAGIMKDDPRLQEAIDDADRAGIVMVAASGNDLYGRTRYPAHYDNVISVDSFDSNGKIMYNQNSESVYLPGGNIVTTYSSACEGKKYVSYSGTSMSAPMLTGVIALILEQNSNLSNRDIVGYFEGYRNVTEFDTVKILEDIRKINR